MRSRLLFVTLISLGIFLIHTANLQGRQTNLQGRQTNPDTNKKMKRLQEGPIDSAVPDRKPAANPESIPPVLGFGGQLDIASTSQARTNRKTVISEYDSNSRLVRTAVIERPNGTLSVKITRNLGADQKDLLQKHVPSLIDHTNSFPSQADGLEIELSIGVSQTFQANDARDFQQKYPSIFQAYQTSLENNSPSAKRNTPQTGGHVGPIPELKTAEDELTQKIKQAVRQLNRQLAESVAELEQLKAQRVQLAKQMGERHPRVLKTDESIANMTQVIDSIRDQIESVRKVMNQQKSRKEFPLPEIKKSSGK